MNSPSVHEVAVNYVAYLSTKDKSLEWASFAALDYRFDEYWDDLWQAIQIIALLPQEIDNVALATVAAGLVEDLLSDNGAAFIDRILAFSAQSPRMAKMLTGVWPSNIDPAIWLSVVEFCRKVPDPIDGTYRY